VVEKDTTLTVLLVVLLSGATSHVDDHTIVLVRAYYMAHYNDRSYMHVCLWILERAIECMPRVIVLICFVA
jgi:hypothetical protein